MKPISTGTGLCALAGAVLLYPLLHRAEPQGGVINAAAAVPVSAATQSRPPALQPPFAPAPPTLPPMGGGGMRPDGGVAMQAVGAGGCEYVLGEPLNWFTEAHPLPSCVSRLEQLFGFGPCDYDRDGTSDHLMWLTAYPVDHPLCAPPTNGCIPLGGNTYFIIDPRYTPDSPVVSLLSPTGQLPEGTGLFRHSLSVNGDSVTVTLQQVVSTEVLQSAVCGVIPCGSQFDYWGVWDYVFRDMDGDGDADLLVYVYGTLADYTDTTVASRVWLENTVPSDPPIAADINGDGYVDGKDLAMVLSAWTP